MLNDTGHDLEWVWDSKETTLSILLKHQNREVCFHPNHSSGTAAVRGNQPCIAGRQYYWELEILTPLYGTDVMVGVGTSKVDLRKYQLRFGSLLGSDEESWGFSYRGFLFHGGILRHYRSGYSQGSIVGVHLDMWLGSITFYLNHRPLGVAFTSIKSTKLYPMVCSTSARSGMRIVRATSFPSSLQFYCLQILGTKRDLVEKVKSIPGLCSYTKKLFWLFPTSLPEQTTEVVKNRPTKRTNDCDYGMAGENYSKKLEGTCIVCQGPLVPVYHTLPGGGNVSKHFAVCLGCNPIV